MMAGNPNWWSMNGMHIPRDSSPFVYPQSDDHRSSDGQDFPVRSWSQLLLGGGGGGGGDDVYSGGLFQQQKKLESWEDQTGLLNMNNIPSAISRVSDVKQESGYGVRREDEFPAAGASSCGWTTPPAVMPSSSPTSCITNNILNFSAAKNHEHSSESISGGVSNKKARVQQSSAQPALKVRKEKLGDRITALHQLVSPFGKTDTASVLSEAIGYIRFLQGQIEALSSPYMRNRIGYGHHGMERGASNQGSEGQQSDDLRSRGLCLVPISCTHHMATDSGGGADYWPPAALGGGF